MNLYARLLQRAAEQRPVRKGRSPSWADEAEETATRAHRVWREMEQLFAGDKKQ